AGRAEWIAEDIAEESDLLHVAGNRRVTKSGPTTSGTQHRGQLERGLPDFPVGRRDRESSPLTGWLFLSDVEVACRVIGAGTVRVADQAGRVTLARLDRFSAFLLELGEDRAATRAGEQPHLPAGLPVPLVHRRTQEPQQEPEILAHQPFRLGHSLA